MKVERIEQLLRAQPPDEPPYRGELLLGPRMVRATSAQVRERRRFAGALNAATFIIVLVGLIVGGLVLGPLAAPKVPPSHSTTTSETPLPSAPLGVIPWIEATPTPSPTPEPKPDPRTLRACTAGDLVLAARGWEGAGGSLAGSASVVNLTSTTCTVGGKPGIRLIDGTGAVIARGGDAKSAPGDELVVLPSGGVASVITVWGNWCGGPPRRPLSVRLSLPGSAGELSATIREGQLGSSADVPRCDSRGDGSTFGVPVALAAPEPSAGGYQPQGCGANELSAYLGEWGAAAGTFYANLVVLNAGGFDCLLESSPTFELADAAGRRLVVARSEPPASASNVLLPSGWAATVRIGNSDWCSPAPVTPLRANLVIGSARLAVEARSPIPVPACMSAPQTPARTLFLDGTLTIPGSPIAPEPDPVDTLPVSVTLSAIPKIAPGGTLDYTVTLTNISPYDQPLNVAAFCPAYTERLLLPRARKAIETLLALNCEPVGLLMANVPVTFRMRLPIPSDSPMGTATLIWQLGSRGPAAKATFTIGS
ncbi:MAG TPA: DUF4232 domain-containing protein [Candidatus Limnocylindrales bacterium]